MLQISLLGSPPKSKCMGFLLTKLWVKGFEGMGYGSQFSANQFGGLEALWALRGYGLLGIWIMGESTVKYCS